MAQFLAMLPIGLLLALSTEAPQKPNWYLNVGYVFSARVMGSEDPRIGRLLSLGYGRSEPKLRLGRYEPEVIYEAHAIPSSSRGYVDINPDRTTSFGLLGVLRYRITPWKGAKTFMDLGWGLQYSTQTTSDQPSQFNSTPTLGFGSEVDWGAKDGYVLARWFHSSNAGTRGNNPGWNQFWIVLGVKL